MVSGSGQHATDHGDRVLLYALGTLSEDARRDAAAAIAVCPECLRELAEVNPVVEAFASWPTDVLRPTASLWERLAQRIATEMGDAPLLPAQGSAEVTEWRDVAPGIACKLLATDLERDRVSMLVRLAPDTEYPPHMHGGVEELHMLEGELIADHETFRPGDYRQRAPGTVDRRVWSEMGCTCLLITSIRDAIL